MLLTVRSAVAEDEHAVVALWRACDLVAPYNDPVVDFRFAKAGSCSDVLVAVDDVGEVAGSVMVGHDGHRGWIYYVAAHPTSRGRELAPPTRSSEGAAPSSRNKRQGGELLRAPRFRGSPACRYEQVVGGSVLGTQTPVVQKSSRPIFATRFGLSNISHLSSANLCCKSRPPCPRAAKSTAAISYDPLYAAPTGRAVRK
jgi:hypothetical protein